MAFPDRRTLNVLMTALLFRLMLSIVYVARTVIVIFAFLILFAYLINPIVGFLQSHSLFFKNLRGPHVAEAYLTLLIVLGLIIHNLAPQLVPQLGRLFRDSPAMMSAWTCFGPDDCEISWLQAENPKRNQRPDRYRTLMKWSNCSTRTKRGLKWTQAGMVAGWPRSHGCCYATD